MRLGLIAGGLVGLLLTAPADAQIGGILKGVDKGLQAGKAVANAKLNETEEQQLGADVSARLREKYGVVQDAAVHRYVTLTGTLLAQASARPKLQWTFIVLDTDGINAFAAPGGYIHITRGALALIRNEAELACVLAHEIAHVTEKHTVNAIEKAALVGVGATVAADVTRQKYLDDFTNKAYASVLENKFDRNDEVKADDIGVKLADKMGYAPAGLDAFLTRLAERNRDLKERSGMFASHPETTDRLGVLSKVTARLKGVALVQARYSASVNFKLVAVKDIAQVAPPGSATAKPEPAQKGGSGALGLGGQSAIGREQSSSSTVASAGSRGVNPDRDARGGPNKALVVVTVTSADVNEFRKGITG